MIGGDRYPNQLAQAELARLVRFLHEADMDWAVARVLPLFDPDDTERARRCWNSHLRAGRFDQELLDDGMLDCYTAMCSHTGMLADGDRRRLAQHWAMIAVQTELDPDERRISRLVADANQLMVAHLSGQGANAGLTGAGRLMDACPAQVAALIAHMMKSTVRLPGFAESAISHRLAKLVAQLLEAVDGDLAEEIAEQAKRLDLRILA